MLHATRLAFDLRLAIWHTKLDYFVQAKSNAIISIHSIADPGDLATHYRINIYNLSIMDHVDSQLIFELLNGHVCKRTSAKVGQFEIDARSHSYATRARVVLESCSC